MRTDGLSWKTNVLASTRALRDEPGKTLFCTYACSLSMVAHTISYHAHRMK